MFTNLHKIGFGMFVGLVLGTGLGFSLGVYFLPILTAEKGLNSEVITTLSASTTHRGVFVRDLVGSDALH